MALPSTILTRSVGYVDLARRARQAKHGTDEIIRDNARIHLAERMGKLRGLPQKIGQILSMSEDTDGAGAFQTLTDSAQPLPFTEIEPVLERAWNSPLDRVVRMIDREGLAASLGQVHRAVLRDAREVAVKVRYPGIRKAVMNDLKVLGWLSAPVGDLRRGFDLNDYRAEIVRNLDEELDYRVEAGHQRHYRVLAAHMPAWIVPEVLTELSNDEVLVSTWVAGERIDDVAHWSATHRSELATVMVRGFCRMLYGHGVLHADPHPGNYRFVRTAGGPKVVLYDYGSVTRLSSVRRLALLKLIEMSGARQGDPFKPLAVLGFNEQLLAPIRHKLAAVCSVLFEPFCHPGKYDMSAWRRAQRISDILGDDRWNLRMAGPAHLIFVVRAFKGLTYYLDKLGADVSWYHAIRPYLNENRAALAGFDVSAPPQQAGTFGCLADHLRVQVTEDGSTKVSLTFPAMAVDNLDALMGEDLARRVRDKGADLADIVRDARHTSYRPQELFCLQEADGARAVRVWLE